MSSKPGAARPTAGIREDARPADGGGRAGPGEPALPERSGVHPAGGDGSSSDDTIDVALSRLGLEAASGPGMKFLEASPDCVKVIDAGGALRYMNRNGRCLMEVTDLAPLVGGPWSSLWPEESRATVAHAVDEARAGRETRFTAECPTAKGTNKVWDVAVAPVHNAAGVVVAILSVSRDITAQRSSEANLRKSEEHFRALANNMAQLAWMADPSGHIFWYNERWYDYTGTTFEDMAGWGWQKVHHPEHVDRVVERITRCFESGEVWEDLFPLRGRDGGYRWFLSRAMPVRGADGTVQFWCGTNTDVTDQRHQSQRLRQLARIIDLSHEAILVRELGGGIVLWNRGCEELYGHDKAKATGVSSYDLLRPRLPMERDAFDTHILTEGSWSGELLHVAADGSDVWVDSRQELMRIGGRKLVLETNRDITDRRSADEIRALLVGELNHRVKNTMAIIQSIAAQTARSTNRIDRFVESFNGRIQSLASAHNVLTDAHWSGADLERLVLSQVNVVGGCDGRVTVDGPAMFLPPQTALQFTLVFHELATNAVKHGALSSPAGRIHISWRTVSENPTVLDLVWTEAGGPPVEAPAARGFGLTLIERTDRLPNLGAEIAFRPQGIVARLRAELADTAAAPGVLFNPGRELIKRFREDARPVRASRKRIMIVDREPADAMLVEEVIYDAGHVSIGPVATIDEALAKLATLVCDAVMVDIDSLRREDVAALLDVLATRGTPAIALGSVARLTEAHVGRISGIVPKPISDRALRDALVAAVGRP